MDKTYIETAKAIAKVVIVTGVTAVVDKVSVYYDFGRRSNAVDGFLNKIGSGAIGIAVGNKAADMIIDSAEELYSKYAGEDN